MSDIHERLKDEFNDRLRLRWSGKEKNWHVEQKFARGYHPSRRANDDDESDEMIRAREGYLQICTVQPGDHMRCERCNYTINVPVNEFRMIQCEQCQLMGWQTKYVVGFFDLDSEHLLDHLRRLDPLRSASNKIREKIAENNKKLYEKEQNRPSELAEAYVKDMSNDLFGIAHQGSTKVMEGSEVSNSRLLHGV